jgi:hypothetical protein
MSMIWDRGLLPFGIFVFFFLLTLSVVFVFGPKRERKRSALLLRHFQGRLVFPSGPLEIPYLGALFRIVRLSSGAGTFNSSGGSYPALYAYTSKTPKLIIGNPESGKYAIGKFLILPPHEVVKLGELSFLIGSESQELREQIGSVLKGTPALAQRLSKLFEREWAHLTVSSEFHVVGFSIQRKTVLRYSALPEETYQRPEILESALQTISDFAEKLGISIYPS